MADEQTPQSDLIDDAIRQAERQLEEKLEALRMSALGEPTARPTSTVDDDVAVLRPTGAMPSFDAQPAWGEGGEQAAVVRSDAPDSWSDTASSGGIGELSASWDDGEDDVATTPPPRQAPRREREPEPWDQPEPVHASWTSTSREDAPRDESAEPRERAPQPRREPSPEPAQQAQPPAPAFDPTPTEDEMQFWAHTRTALRNLQQVTDQMPGEVVSGVTGEVERLLRDELAHHEQGLRAVQQQLQQGLPRVVERIEGAFKEGLASPITSIHQLRDEMAQRLDDHERDLQAGIRDEFERSGANLHSALQRDVSQLEQSVATNVTRLAQNLEGDVQRVGQDVELVGETLVRVERGVRADFERVDEQLRTAMERVERTFRDELVEPTETVKKLDEELPARFGRIERTLAEQVQSSQRELTASMASIVDANRATLDRLGSLSSALDDDRARRAEDVELLVDTFSTGWEGLAGAVKALYEQGATNAQRIDAIEQRLGELRDLESAVDTTMRALTDQVGALSPAPIVVTVAHPDAEVQSTARGGWLPARD